MLFTKQHYEAIARLLGESRAHFESDNGEIRVAIDLEYRFRSMLRLDNEKFDGDAFTKAIGEAYRSIKEAQSETPQRTGYQISKFSGLHK